MEIQFSGFVFQREHIAAGDSVFTKNFPTDVAGDFDVKIVFADGSDLSEENIGYGTLNARSLGIFSITEEKELEFSQDW